MNKRNVLFCITCGLFIFGFMCIPYKKTAVQSSRPARSSVMADQPPVKLFAASLKERSRTNETFQADFKEFGRACLNQFLAVVPFYGINGQLNETEFKSHAFLTLKGAELWLYGKDGTNTTLTARYEGGVLWKVQSFRHDYLGAVGHQPDKLKSWEPSDEKWTEDEAARQALKYAANLGFTTNGLAVRAMEKSIPLPEDNAQLRFYDVEFFDKSGQSDRSPTLEVRFRFEKGRGWMPVYWFNNYRQTTDTISTDFSGLWDKYFKDSGK